MKIFELFIGELFPNRLPLKWLRFCYITGLPRSSSSPTSTHRMEKGGCKCANPSRGGHEHDVTNFRKALRSALVKSFSKISHSQTMTFIGFKDFKGKNPGFFGKKFETSLCVSHGIHQSNRHAFSSRWYQCHLNT